MIHTHKRRTTAPACVLAVLLACGTVAAAEQGVSRTEFEALAKRVRRLETLLQQQQNVIQEQQKTIERQRAELARLRAGEAEEAASTTLSLEGIASGLQQAEFHLGATGIIQGATGVDTRLSPEGNQTDASGSVDLEVEIPVQENGKLYAHVEAGNGAGLDEKIPTLTGLNADADDDDALRLSEFWYEHRFLNERCAVKIGKIDMTGTCGIRENAFDANAVANDECTQFLSPALVNNITVPFPDYTIGAELWVSPADWLDIGFGAGDADIDPASGDSAPDWNNIGDDVFAIAEVDLHTAVAGRPGNWRFYVWNHAADYPDVIDSGKTHRNYGWGLSLDQEILDGCTVFARFGQQREDVAAVALSWSAGLQLSAAPLGRENDAFGIGFVAAMLGDDWEEAARAAGSDPADEYHVEVYYNWQVNDVLTLSPDLQWVGNPNGERANDDIWVLGLRAQLSF